MATQNMNQNLNSQNTTEIQLNDSYSSNAVASHQVYNEMLDQPVQSYDELTQLRVNLETLGDLQNRLTFVLREVRYLMKIS